jgi:hypothetical protein
MKNIFKLSLSLLGNQILASVGGAMCIIFVHLIAGDTIPAHILFLAINMSFFVYIEYRAAFTHGFHDADRRNKPESKKYLYKGFLSGAISVIPLLIIIAFFVYFYVICHKPWMNLIKIILRSVATYYVFPMLNLFPNHSLGVILSSLIIPLVVPTLGYIAGYKNFEWTYSILKIQKKRATEPRSEFFKKISDYFKNH